MKWIWLAGASAISVVAVVLVAQRIWERDTRRFVRELTGQAKGTPGLFEAAQVAGMPPVVERYFRFALSPGQPLVRTARFEQAGVFAVRPDQWRDFTAVEYFAVGAPGFLWDARIHMTSLATARVRDSYFRGEGSMLVRLAGLIPIVSQRGTPEMASGALMRYLAEAAWLPAALLPSAGVRWEGVDDSTARATLEDGGVRVSLNFHFGEQGEVVRVEGERYRDVAGKGVLTPWSGEFGDYRREQGMMIPNAGDVAWVLPEGRISYWRGRIVKAEYEFSR